MSEEDIALITLADTPRKHTAPVNADDAIVTNYDSKSKEDETKKKWFLRFPGARSTWRPRFGKVRNRLQKMSCLKGSQDEEMAMLDVPRHKSIDIGVGLARRVSLFIFTRRSVCVHPYHPYTPTQTTRKILTHMDDR